MGNRTIIEGKKFIEQEDKYFNKILNKRNELKTLLLYYFVAFKKRAAYTLAEVLITLGIVGVVSALTIPALNNNIKKHVLHNQFIKTYAELNMLAKNFYLNENMSIPEYVATVRGYSSSWGYNNATPKIREYFKSTSIIGGGDYWFRNTQIVNDYNLAKVPLAAYVVPCSAIATPFMDNITGRYYCLGRGRLDSVSINNYITTDICVDINGKKKPNMWGYDRFAFTFTQNNSVIPYSSGGCSYSGSSNGCAVYAAKNIAPDGKGDYWHNFLK